MRHLFATTRADVAAAEIFAVETRMRRVELETGRAPLATVWQGQRGTARVVVNGKLGAASTIGPLENDLLDRTILAAEFGDECGVELCRETGCKTPDEVRDDGRFFDARVSALTGDILAARGGDLLAKLRAGAGAGAVVRVVVQAGERRERWATMAGASREFSRTVTSIFACLSRSNHAGAFEVTDAMAGTRADEFGDVFAERLLAEFCAVRPPIAVPTGTYRTVISPGVVWELLQPLLADRRAEIGEVVADARLSLVDDPADVFGMGGRPFDTEGIPTRRLPLVENGRLAAVMHTRKTAAAAGVSPTGHGVRPDGAAHPTAGAHALKMAGGGESLADLLGDFDGIWIVACNADFAAEMDTGIVGGRIALGHRVIAGRRVARLKGASFRIDAREALRHRLLAIASDVREVGPHRLPFVLLDGVAIVAG